MFPGLSDEDQRTVIAAVRAAAARRAFSAGEDAISQAAGAPGRR
jgi:hypothetical protein